MFQTSCTNVKWACLIQAWLPDKSQARLPHYILTFPWKEGKYVRIPRNGHGIFTIAPNREFWNYFVNPSERVALLQSHVQLAAGNKNNLIFMGQNCEFLTRFKGIKFSRHSQSFFYVFWDKKKLLSSMQIFFCHTDLKNKIEL